MSGTIGVLACSNEVAHNWTVSTWFVWLEWLYLFGIIAFYYSLRSLTVAFAYKIENGKRE